MTLIGFSLGSDCISVEKDGKVYDLHNEFEFAGMHYSTIEKTVDLVWSRDAESRFATREVAGLRLCFEEVSLLRVHERDPEIPYSEDTCLESIGFIAATLEDSTVSYSLGIPNDEIKHINVCLQNGGRIRIGASRATLRLVGT